ncbi:MAG: hypothetical protein LBU36_04000 [Clostridiales bacterium]|jgi:hypothetical protein|nr:hypothetical protein [Clostridiales bacterium]
MAFSKKSIIFGFGLGVTATCSLLGAVYPAVKPKQPVADVSISDSEIIERAHKLGMVTLSEKAAAGKENPPAEPDPADALNETNEPDAAGEPGGLSPSNMADITPPAPPEPLTPVSEKGSSATVSILKGSSAAKISGIFKDAGLVGDEAAFLEYIKDKEKTRQLPYGNFTFSLDRTYTFDELLDTLNRR